MIVKWHFVVVVQSLTRVELFVTPWTAVQQASLCCSHLLNCYQFSSVA